MYIGSEELSGVTVRQDPDKGLVEVSARPGLPVELKFAVKNEGVSEETVENGFQNVSSSSGQSDPAKGVVLKSVSLLTDVEGFEMRGEPPRIFPRCHNNSFSFLPQTGTA